MHYVCLMLGVIYIYTYMELYMYYISYDVIMRFICIHWYYGIYGGAMYDMYVLYIYYMQSMCALVNKTSGASAGAIYVLILSRYLFQ